MSERDVRPDNFQCIIDHGEESVPDDFRREAIEWASDTITTLREQLAEAKAGNARLREALELLLEVYCSLVDSGDCGCWESKDDECVIKARQALTPTEPSK